jgi:hypothetical protein
MVNIVVGGRGGAIILENTSHATFNRVTLSHHGQQALWITSNCSDINFNGGEIHDLGTGALRVGTLPKIPGSTKAVAGDPAGNRRITLADSRLYDGGWVFPSGTAVLVHSDASEVVIEHNEIFNFSYTAISLGWSWTYQPQLLAGGHRVIKNRIHHLGFPRREVGDAMACIYTLGQLNGTSCLQCGVSLEI